MRKQWKGMFMNPHLWETVYLAHRAGYDACGAMLLPRGGQGPRHELLEDPKLWDNVQNALDETGLFLDGIGNCIIDDPDNIHPYGMGVPPEPDDLREYFEFAGKHSLGGVQTSIWTANQDLAAERFAHLCDVCGEYGLTVNLEFVAWGICDSLAKARTLLETVNRKLEEAKAAAHCLGVGRGIDPFMTLSFMALPVIPTLRITTRGVFDVSSQSYV